MRDEKYRKEVTDHVLSEEDTPYTGKVYTRTNAQTVEELAKANEAENATAMEENETTGAGDYVESVFTPLGDIDDGKQYWSEGSVKLMLASIEELQPKVGKCIAVKTKVKMNGIVSARMAAENYPFSPTQIENKFRGMERQYKKTVLNNRQTGRSRQTCPFEKELGEVLGNKKGLNPEFFLESTDVPDKPRSQSVEEDLSSDVDQVLSDNTPSRSSQAAKRRKTGAADAIFVEMAKVREQKSIFQSKVLGLLKKMEERVEKKERRRSPNKNNNCCKSF